MLTVRDLLSAARSAQSLPSNYALAKLLEVRENDVSRWHNGRNIPAPAMVVRLAQLAQLDPAEVLPAIEAQRSTDEAVRAAWARAAQRLALASVAVVCAVLSLFIGGGPDGGALVAMGVLVLPLDTSCLSIHRAKYRSRQKGRFARPGSACAADRICFFRGLVGAVLNRRCGRGAV